MALNPGVSHFGQPDILGILITGRSGIGKSELALNLIDRGHSLIADDAPLLNRVDNDIIGQCPETLQDFLNVRGLGVLNIRFLYDETAIKTSQRLDLIIRLVDTDEPAQDTAQDTLLFNHISYQHVLGITIPERAIKIKPGRDLALWVECAARDLQLRQQGYHAEQELQQRLDRIIERQSSCA